VLHALQRLCGHAVPVGMANTVNLINANALLAVRPGGLVRSATYHVWDLLQNHTGPIALRVGGSQPAALRPVRQGTSTDASGRPLSRPALVPALDVVATLAADRRTLYVSAINRDRSAGLEAQLVLDGRSGGLPQTARALCLGADVPDLLAANSTPAPDAVGLRDLGPVDVTGGRYRFPAHSVTVLGFALA
jgi:alpha-N-arabinofuranosidase